MVAGWSLAGSPWARLPPTVARLRTSGSAITAAVSTRIGYFDRTSGRGLERRLAHQGPDLQEAALFLDVVEAGDAADVHEVRRLGEAQLEQGQQALPSGEDLGLLAEAARAAPAPRAASWERGSRRTQGSSLKLLLAASGGISGTSNQYTAKITTTAATTQNDGLTQGAHGGLAQDLAPEGDDLDGRGRSGPRPRRPLGRRRRCPRPSARLLQLRAHRLGELLEHLVRHVLHQAAAELGQDPGDVHLGDDGHLGLARGLLDEAAASSCMSAPPRPLTSWPEATISAVRAGRVELLEAHRAPVAGGRRGRP